MGSGYEGVVSATARVPNTYADIYKNSVSYLRAAHIGSARILWKEAGTGYKWALVCWQSPAPYGFAKIAAMKTMSGADWTDYVTNQEYPLYVEANPCSDLAGGDCDTTITLKLGINPSYQSGYTATAPTGMITQVGAVVGYLSFTCYKMASPSPITFDGWVVPYMGDCWPDWTRGANHGMDRPLNLGRQLPVVELPQRIYWCSQRACPRHGSYPLR